MARKHRKAGIVKQPVEITTTAVPRKIVLDPKAGEYVVVNSTNKQGRALGPTTQRGKRNEGGKPSVAPRKPLGR